MEGGALWITLRTECQENKNVCSLIVKQLQFSWATAYASASSEDITWIEMWACLSVTFSLASLSLRHLPWTHCSWWRHEETCIVHRPPETIVTGSWDSSWRVTCCYLCSEIPEWQWLALIGVQLVAPTERPLTEGVCGRHGVWDLSLVTRNSFGSGHAFL